jgi:hypothetical protein
MLEMLKEISPSTSRAAPAQTQSRNFDPLRLDKRARLERDAHRHGDDLEAALEQFAKIATRLGAPAQTLSYRPVGPSYQWSRCCRCPACASVSTSFVPLPDSCTAACHSMTSSARTSTVAGTLSPIALAALRLSTSRNLVGRCTGRSAGFAPFRICPV